MLPKREGTAAPQVVQLRDMPELSALPRFPPRLAAIDPTGAAEFQRALEKFFTQFVDGLQRNLSEERTRVAELTARVVVLEAGP